MSILTLSLLILSAIESDHLQEFRLHTIQSYRPGYFFIAIKKNSREKLYPPKTGLHIFGF